MKYPDLYRRSRSNLNLIGLEMGSGGPSAKNLLLGEVYKIFRSAQKTGVWNPHHPGS